MKRLAVCAAIVLAVQLVLTSVHPASAFAPAAPAASSDPGYISGSVYVDSNRNGAADPGEAAIAGAVYVRSQANPDAVQVAATDAAGNYVIGNLALGRYDVWAASGATAGSVRQIEIDEVNAAVTLDLPVVNSSDDLEGTEIKLLFLPLLAHY